jgi:hypothetical protein
MSAYVSIRQHADILHGLAMYKRVSGVSICTFVLVMQVN